MGGSMRGQLARLRTHVEPGGMNYKGFNIAMHEMGHNIEQTFSLNEVDHTLLAGVPNTAFTEALAMIVQGHDLEVLGMAAPDARAEALKTLNDFWATAEISGVALVDMAVWHWMYEHPDATPAELKAATLRIARDVWNRYYAPVFKRRDVTLLAVYSHMICEVLYLPDYPIGHFIGFQIEEQMKQAGPLRRGVRADGEVRQRRPRPVDETRHRRARRRRGAVVGHEAGPGGSDGIASRCDSASHARRHDTSAAAWCSMIGPVFGLLRCQSRLQDRVHQSLNFTQGEDSDETPPLNRDARGDRRRHQLGNRRFFRE